MKKKYIIVPIFALFVVTILLINKNQEKNIDFKDMFDKWDKGTLKDTEGTTIMNAFVNFLIKNPQIRSEDIQSFSPQIKIYEKSNFRIIEYIENPKFYGSSAKGSYHIVMYDRIAEMIDSNGSIQINEIIKLNDELYYIYVTDYKSSNITGINIFSITINKNSIEYKPIIAKDEIINGFKFNDSLYYDDEHIYFENIRNDGSEVLIRVKDTIHMLILKEDGLYHLIEHSS